MTPTLKLWISHPLWLSVKDCDKLKEMNAVTTSILACKVQHDENHRELLTDLVVQIAPHMGMQHCIVRQPRQQCFQQGNENI